MKYSTTSLSAITLCVCMMLSHHTNGMDMWGTPSPFTNNNPNQMPMTEQPWKQQPNTNIEFESINWNNAFRPILSVHQSNKQAQPQSAENMIIRTAVDPRNKNIYIHFPDKYKFKPMGWSKNLRIYRQQKETMWGDKKVLVLCYKGSERYENAKRFYDYVDRIDDPEYQRRLGDILFKRIANGQTEDKKMGCFVFDRFHKYIFMQSFIRRTTTFTIAKQIPNMVARIMEAVSILNKIGVVYGSVGTEHIMVAEDGMGRIHDIKLLHFDRSTVHEDFRELAANPDMSPTSRLTAIYSTFVADVQQTSYFISSLFLFYRKILTVEFQLNDYSMASELRLYNMQRIALVELSDMMVKAESPMMVMSYMVYDQYHIIASKSYEEWQMFYLLHSKFSQ